MGILAVVVMVEDVQDGAVVRGSVRGNGDCGEERKESQSQEKRESQRQNNKEEKWHVKSDIPEKKGDLD